MSLPREQKKSQSAWLDFAVFAGVLAFLGYSLQVFLAARSATPSKLEKPDLSEAEKLAQSRKPASQTTPASTVASTEVLRLSCLHAQSSHNFSSSARLLQIHAPFCQDDAKSNALSWKAMNETSGEEIMVFVNTKEKSLSTNYFTLKNGANVLVFVQDLGKGQSRTEKLQIMRSGSD